MSARTLLRCPACDAPIVEERASGVVKPVDGLTISVPDDGADRLVARCPSCGEWAKRDGWRVRLVSVKRADDRGVA